MDKKNTVFILAVVCFLALSFAVIAGTGNSLYSKSEKVSKPELIREKSQAESGNEKQDWPVHLRILAGPEGGQWYSMADSVSSILSRELLPCSYRKGGGISNIENINNKMGDLGFTLTSFLGGATSGEPEYEDIHADSVRIISNIYPQVLYFLVRTEFATQNKISCVEDLINIRAPVRFAMLKKGTASEFVVRVLLKYGYNTDYALLRGKGWRIFFNNYPETADDFVAGNLDCFAYTAGTHVPLLLDMENYTMFTALPVQDKVLNVLSEKFKFGSYVIDPELYKGITKPIKTMSDFSCMIVRKDLPDDLVYGILSSLWKHREEISEKLIEFKNYSPETAVPKGVPFHPGAKKFWDSFRE